MSEDKQEQSIGQKPVISETNRRLFELIGDTVGAVCVTVLCLAGKLSGGEAVLAILALLGGVEIMRKVGTRFGGIAAILLALVAPVTIETALATTTVVAVATSQASCSATPRQVVHTSVVTTGAIVEQLVNANEEQYRQATQSVSLDELEPYEVEFTQRAHALAAMSSALFVAANINNMVGVSEDQRRLAARQALDSLQEGLDALTTTNTLPSLQLTETQRSSIRAAFALLQSIIGKPNRDAGTDSEAVHG